MAENLRRNGGKSPCRWQTRADLCNENGILCSRYCIRLASIEEVDRLGSIYDANVMITRNLGFPDRIALVLYDEELEYP